MIEIIGPEDRDETRYAERLAALLRQAWPDIEESSDVIKIASCAKVFGGRVQDIDLVILARLNGRRFRPRRKVLIQSPDGAREHLGDISLRNLVLTIELKSHDPRDVRFDGLGVSVRYRQDGWKSATEQAVEQMFSFLSDCDQRLGERPRVINLVALQNVEDADLPRRPHNILAGNQGLASILTTLAEMRQPWLSGGTVPSLSCCNDGLADRLERLPIFIPLQPTKLDRRRMERLAQRAPQLDTLEDDLGQKAFILRGHGGTGKTSLLLNLAARAFHERGARSLLLTYNQALAADLRRLMALTAIPGADDAGGIRVETVITLVGRVLQRFDLLREDEDLLSDYPARARMLAELIAAGDISEEQLAGLRTREPDLFLFDHVLIDEGQDWPPSEVEIIRSIFGPERIVVADGIDQLVRGDVASWRYGAAGRAVRVEPLHDSLRMKSNLASFTRFVAGELGVPGWNLRPNDQAPGGKALLVEGDLLRSAALHHTLIAEAKQAGNSPIDLLYVVHPELARVGADGLSKAASFLASQGFSCWDGTSYDARRDMPRDVMAPRIVHYESCRGLEGWTVIAAALDCFWERRLAAGADVLADSLVLPEQAARQRAAQWMMIPLSRAMDTLVLNVTRRDSEIGRVLERAARAMPDIVSWTP
ncbi:hypothetical protein K9B35_07730 [Sphingomonas sp. R647]|uniref:hypothetical protein n=1 Tax=Sphingomonas sp. R647 TaxID=2875233 RepID=UPI001CD407DA|nr:hypothetical protein [Sphingomonas sp. R647]MCA1197853.1 hypothetical protein [Sphingomonas sp. R647]